MTDIDALPRLIRRAMAVPHSPACPGRFPECEEQCICERSLTRSLVAALREQQEEIARLTQPCPVCAERSLVQRRIDEQQS
jgi:hypothetical protein